MDISGLKELGRMNRALVAFYRHAYKSRGWRGVCLRMRWAVRTNLARHGK